MYRLAHGLEAGKMDDAVDLLLGKNAVESGAVDAFGSILESSVALLEPLGSLISAVLPALTAALKPIAETVALIADTANVIVGLFTFNGDKIKTALGLNASSGQLSNMQRASGAYNGYRYSQSAGWIAEGARCPLGRRKGPVGRGKMPGRGAGAPAAQTGFPVGGRC